MSTKEVSKSTVLLDCESEIASLCSFFKDMNMKLEYNIDLIQS